MILCLGEAIVDLVCEREVEAVHDANAFVPHFGGALANVAVAASRAGAVAGLAGGVGDDDWGHWLGDRLRAEGVDLSFFELVPGIQTPVAFVSLDRAREPRFQIYGDGIAAGLHSLDGRLEDAVAAASAVVFGSNTLVGETERQLTAQARDLAIERGVPVLFDPNLRPNRWQDMSAAVELCRSLVPGSTLVRANAQEAALLADGDVSNAEAAADAIVRMGATVAVVTLGADGALARGAVSGRAPGVSVDVVSPMGAGDAFMGALAAGLAARAWDPARTAEVLPAACAAGAEACTVWGALT